jgi:hypothetical protein
MSPVSLALVLFLVVPAVTDAQTSTQRAKKQRRAGQPVGQELEAQSPVGLEQSSAWLEQQRAVQEPPAAPAVAPRTAGTTAIAGTVVTDRDGTGTTGIEKGARRVGILPTVLPPF